MDECIFCKNAFDIIYEDDFVYAIYDGYPVSKGHILIISKEHVATYFDASIDIRKSVDKALFILKDLLVKEYNPDGFNIGINNGLESGQTIFHLHIHLIPRYKGDILDPTGGVRGVIPSKQKY